MNIQVVDFVGSSWYGLLLCTLLGLHQDHANRDYIYSQQLASTLVSHGRMWVGHIQQSGI